MTKKKTNKRIYEIWLIHYCYLSILYHLYLMRTAGRRVILINYRIMISGSHYLHERGVNIIQ